MILGFISAIAGAGMAAIGTGISVLAGARAAREKRRELAKREKDNESWYNQKYNEVGTERAEAQAALSAMRAAQQQRMQAAAGTSAVMGGSAGSSMAEKVAANQAMAQAIGNINASADAYKQGVENTYMQEKGKISDARIAAAEAQGQNVAAAGSQISQMGASMMGGGSDWLKSH